MTAALNTLRVALMGIGATATGLAGANALLALGFTALTMLAVIGLYAATHKEN